MASTPTQGFPYPGPNDIPDIPSDIRALAEALDTKITLLDATISDLQSRTTGLEDGTGGAGWIPIAEGTASGADFSIDLTAAGKFPSPPLWTRVNVFMRVDLTDVANVHCQVNGDNDAVYRHGSTMIDSEVPSTFDGENWAASANTSWAIAQMSTISTGVLDFDLIHAHANPGLMSFMSRGERQSDDGTFHRHVLASGSLTSAKTATSLRFSVSGGQTFVNCWWRALGLRMTAP